MVRLDLAGMTSREVNRRLKDLIKTETEIELDNPHSIHNFATALIAEQHSAGRRSATSLLGWYIVVSQLPDLLWLILSVVVFPLATSSVSQTHGPTTRQSTL